MIFFFFFFARLKIFIPIFDPKMADFTLLVVKKNEQMGKKRSVGPVKQGFLFSWPYCNINVSIVLMISMCIVVLCML